MLVTLYFTGTEKQPIKNIHDESLTTKLYSTTKSSSKKQLKNEQNATQISMANTEMAPRDLPDPACRPDRHRSLCANYYDYFCQQ